MRAVAFLVWSLVVAVAPLVGGCAGEDLSSGAPGVGGAGGGGGVPGGGQGGEAGQGGTAGGGTAGTAGGGTAGSSGGGAAGLSGSSGQGGESVIGAGGMSGGGSGGSGGAGSGGAEGGAAGTGVAGSSPVAGSGGGPPAGVCAQGLACMPGTEPCVVTDGTSCPLVCSCGPKGFYECASSCCGPQPVANNEGCDQIGQKCNDACGHSCSCSGKVWTCSQLCQTTCPDKEPGVGECAIVPDLVCHYELSQSSTLEKQCTCSADGWFCEFCPKSEPSQEMPCQVQKGAVCRYAQPDGDSHAYQCNGGSWEPLN